jgi:hypothetical protein
MTVMNSIEVRGLVKRYGDVTGVDGVDLRTCLKIK